MRDNKFLRRLEIVSFELSNFMDSYSFRFFEEVMLYLNISLGLGGFGGFLRADGLLLCNLSTGRDFLSVRKFQGGDFWIRAAVTAGRLVPDSV